MYTFKQWEDFCQQLSVESRLVVRTVSDSLKEPDGPVFVIKHDVETRADLAYQVAKIEKKWNIRSTYYFHSFFLDSMQDIKFMQKIQSLGHEVGYHYDVLDICNGDYTQALNMFSNDIKKFHDNGIKISSICPHGNPLKLRDGWNSNKDFFKSKNIREKFTNLIDVVNDINLFHGATYVSDAGFKLQEIGDICNNDKANSALDLDIELYSLLQLETPVILSVHTHRMRKSAINLIAKKIIFTTIKPVVRTLTKFRIFREMLNPLFKLAKKF